MSAPDPEQWERAAEVLETTGLLPDQVAQFRDNAKRELRQKELGDQFTVLAVGVTRSVVCTSLPDDEILETMTHSGTTHGWQVDRDMEHETCHEWPDTHRHVYLVC